MIDWQARLRNLLIQHRVRSGKSLAWYVAGTGISRRTLLNIAAGKGRTLYIVGRRLEEWLKRNSG